MKIAIKHCVSPFVNRTGIVHYPYREGNCSVCHLPHSGVENGNLTIETDRLCAMCHPKPHKDFSHPVEVKPSAEFDLKANNSLNFHKDDKIICTTLREHEGQNLLTVLHTISRMEEDLAEG